MNYLQPSVILLYLIYVVIRILLKCTMIYMFFIK